MLKTLLATSAVAAVLAFGAGPAAVMAQTAPATDQPATDETAPEPVTPADPGAMAPATTPATPATAPEAATGAGSELAAIPRDELIGTDIKAGPDNETVASVEDVLLDADGNVKNIVARFGGFLGFGETTVLLMPDEVMVHRTEAGKPELTTTLTPEALKDRPEYTAPTN
ncbi:hypothetical protein HNP73_002635 [Amaricoccus macauensis]|uniref:PRC-barrel domain-containing protein n=1 Tax=Amaricoccus macauensis TaxID=57001 RepID=A0A840SI51_9RHOB|nr:PRC-barrel domain-containing protein [Amaricoccus macauensis]MBB5222699.1 hypothetical protein [Amaricoccus macauensis]